MNTSQQPEALRLADKYEAHGFLGDHRFAKDHWCIQAAAELRSQHTRIAELEAQLSAIGAGGVEPLRKQASTADVADERDAFEKWLRIKPCGAAHDFGWEAWKARAALTATPAAGELATLQAGLQAAAPAVLPEAVDLKERIARAGVEQRRAVREAVLQEREACAKACEGMEVNRDWVPGSLWGNIRGEMAAAIRARGEPEQPALPYHPAMMSEIINMADEIAICFSADSKEFDHDGLLRFAAMVQANEREACAQVAEDGFFGNPGELNHEIAAAIRARQ